MDIDLPDNLKQEQQALEVEIREAFRKVNRVGGISWSESAVVDDDGDETERLLARLKDKEKSWEELVHNPNWHEHAGNGGYCFLDPIGFRYYLAPALVRGIRDPYRGELEYVLRGDREFWQKQYEKLDARQKKVIARVVRFMLARPMPEWETEEEWGKKWRRAYEDYWRQWDTPGNTV